MEQRSLLQTLRAWEYSRGKIVSSHTLPARQATFTEVSEHLKSFLPSGFDRLYAHQAVALEKGLRGESFTLATSTASGKTLALALPARVKRGSQHQATLLCVAPTKALVEQWAEQLRHWGGSGIIVDTYTSDTPQHQRPRIRARVQYLVTTPDMLHVGVLPYHGGWNRFFSHLGDVILDESHTYCGAFGSHMVHILRRLQRVIAYYRSEPPIILLASATIGNPAEHASQLLGYNVDPITLNGAPSGERQIVFWQPPEDRGHSDEAAGLMAFYLSQGVRTILFGQARQSVERMCRTVHSYLPEALQQKVVAYRAGYPTEERRKMQQQLASGEMLGVVCTNALELGIDIGHLDVSILDGFPGSIASFWQQAGRAGRREQNSLSILVLREDALDQYFAEHPANLLERPPEHAMVNIQNPVILPRQLICAAFEGALTTQDIELFGPGAAQTVTSLVEQNLLSVQNGRYVLMDRTASPAYAIPLRQIGARLAMMSQGRKLEETDLFHTVTECYPGAIYLSQGKSYLVDRLDLEQGTVFLHPREVNYETTPLTNTDVNIYCTTEQKTYAAAQFYIGEVLVTRQTTEFMKKHRRYKTLLEKRQLATPLSFTLDTQAFWMLINPDVITDLAMHRFDPAGSLHATEHALIGLLPLFVLGDRRDIGGVSVVPFHPQTQLPTIFLYDGIEGGVGYAQEAYRQFDALARATLERLQVCDCTSGCHACVMSPKCGNDNRPLDKAGAIYLLQALLH